MQYPPLPPFDSIQVDFRLLETIYDSIWWHFFLKTTFTLTTDPIWIQFDFILLSTISNSVQRHAFLLLWLFWWLQNQYDSNSKVVFIYVVSRAIGVFHSWYIAGTKPRSMHMKNAWLDYFPDIPYSTDFWAEYLLGITMQVLYAPIPTPTNPEFHF